MVRLTLMYVLAFALLAYADMASTLFAHASGNGREANPMVADGEGGMDVNAFIAVNIFVGLLTGVMFYWALTRRRLVPEHYLNWPILALKDAFSFGVTFTPFLKRFEGRGAFMYLAVAVGFVLFRPLVILSNVWLGFTGSGLFDGVFKFWIAYADGWLLYALFIASTMLPLWSVSLLVTAMLLKRERHSFAEGAIV